jgi:chaperonin GroES
VNNATVVAVGPGTVTEKGDVIPLSILPGDQVLLPEYGGTKVEVEEGVEMFLFREGDLLGKWGQN